MIKTPLSVANKSWSLIVFAAARSPIILTHHGKPWVVVSRCTGRMKSIAAALSADEWTNREAQRDPFGAARIARETGALIVRTKPALVLLPVSGFSRH